MGNKYTIESVKKDFENSGYTLLSNKYKNDGAKLKYKCPNSHCNEIRYSSWRQGSRCRTCYIERQRNNIEDIKKEFDKKNYILLSNKYKRASLRLDYICPGGHRNSMSWLNFRNGSECPDCVIERNRRKYKLSFDTVKESFEKEGYLLLTDKYINANHKLKFRCSNNHEHSITWLHWNGGVRCVYCFRENNYGRNNGNWRGGISQAPYCFVWKDKEYRKFLEARDHGKFCWNPHCNGKGTRESFHHINYKKNDCNPKNIIKICNSCNSTANANREWWAAFYTEIMRRRF